MKWTSVKDGVPDIDRKFWMSSKSTNGDWCAHAVWVVDDVIWDGGDHTEAFKSFCEKYKITRWAYNEDYDIDSECSEECY